MKSRQLFSLQARARSFTYAAKGIGHFFRSEPHAWIHLIALVVVVIVGCIVDLSIPEWCLIALASGMVLTAEIFNTALETLTDLISPAQNPLAGKTKDLASAAVLIASIAAAAIGLLVFLPHLL